MSDHECLGCELDPEDAGMLTAYFPASFDPSGLVSELANVAPELQCRVRDPLPDRAWLAEWKQSYEGFPIGERYYVLPTWKESPVDDDGRTLLRIDPEQAFGTGTHETTRLCVRALEHVVTEGQRVIDVGTGTGILAMVAAHRGATVLALEQDTDAAVCARDNVRRNGFEERINVEPHGYEAFERLEADVIVANILTSVLERAVPRMFGTLVLSGILASEVDAFVASLPDACTVVDRLDEGEWCALIVNHEA